MYQAVKKEEDPKVASKIPEPKGYKLLISPVEVDEKTEGGLYMPDQIRDAEGVASIIGFVVSMGSDAYKDKDKFPNGAWCDVGDYVCYAKYSGQKFMYKGMKLLLIFDDQVIMKVETPSLLDPTYHLTN